MILPHCKSILMFSAALGAIALSSCADDNPALSRSADKYVSFDVEVSSNWNNASSTRSLGQQSLSKALPMAMEGDTLYLVPKISDGINLTTASGTTRSSISDSDNIASIGIFAAMKPESAVSDEGLKPDYMNNVEVTRDNSWTPVDEYLWPGSGKLHFNAYSPFTGNASNQKEGIISLPTTDDNTPLSLNYVTPAEVMNQIDLLISQPTDAITSPCALIFSHALTAIRFATGSEMAPCTVKKIEISDVYADGTLNMETREWSNLSSLSSFSVEPQLTLTAAENSKFVAPDTEITSADNTFLLIPQTLSSSAQISITLETNGQETTLNASLDGTTWIAGKTITYRISANPASDTLILQILDSNGNQINSLTSQYTGDVLNFAVRSIKETATGDSVAIPWKAEFVDDDGNVIERPQWITDFPSEGDASASCQATTVLQTPSFVSMSEDTKTLRQAADINESSGMNPYNLSNSTGAVAVENTANCYLIHAPGKYSLPLVYGNAVKDGASNPSSYTSSSTNQYALKRFLNHLGNAISDPYIYNNTGCTPASASLVWEGRLCLIQDVELSADKKNLEFTVPAIYIRQGDAMLCVKDNDGDIMWSWHIWVTPYIPGENIKTFTSNGSTMQLLSRNIGQITNGDDTLFPACATKVRFTQITSDDTDPLTATLDITRNEKHVVTPDCYSFYQWGRKDPMISSIKEWYAPDHHEITQISTADYDTYSGTLPMVSEYICTPDVFWRSAHDKAHEYINLWNPDLSKETNSKSIYDPSPVGYKVTFGKIFNDFVNSGTLRKVTSTDATRAGGYYVTLTGNDDEIFFPAYGYRSSSTGQEAGYGASAQVWSTYYDGVKSHDRTLLTNSRALVFSTGNLSFPPEPRALGFGIRCEKE